MITTTTVMIRIIIIVIITTVTNSIICKSEDSRRGAGCVVRPQKVCLISSLIPLGGGGWSREMDTTMYEINVRL